MKSKALCFLGCLVLVVGVSGNSWGQVYMDKGLGDSGCVSEWEEMRVGKQLIGVSCGPGIGARVAYFFPYSNDDVESEIAYEGLISYAVSNVFATTLGVGYTKPEFIAPVEGDLELTYMNLTFELRGEPEPNFGLYLGFGPSLFFTDFKSKGDYDLRSDDSFGFHVALGIDYFVTQSIAINIDVKHIWFLDGLKYRVDGVSQSKEKLDSMVYGAGLKYFF